MLQRRPEFPGMDPWLEHPDLWPDVHNSLITAIRDALGAALDPRYFVGVESRTMVVSRERDERVTRPELALPVEVEEVEEWFLEIRAIETRDVVTVIEVLSPTNKSSSDGRGQYIGKRLQVLTSRTNLVEIDLLRAGPPMPMAVTPRPADYRVMVSRRATRPRASWYSIGVRSPLPPVPIPLLPGDPEFALPLNEVLHGLLARAHYYRLPDYDAEAVPPLRPGDAEWAAAIVARARAAAGAGR